MTAAVRPPVAPAVVIPPRPTTPGQFVPAIQAPAQPLNAYVAYEQAIAGATPTQPPQPAVLQRTQEFMSTTQRICDYWAHPGAFNSRAVTRRDGATPLTLPPAPAANGPTYAVGDIHGDLNHLLMNLIVSGAARFRGGEPTMVFYDTVNHVRVWPHQINGDLTRYRLIANIEKNPSFVGELVVMGDILDRGMHSDECLCTLMSVMADERAHGGNQLHMVFGDHEIYAFFPGPFTPNYDETRSVCPPSIVSWETVGSLIRHAIGQGWMEYAYMGRGGSTVFSHSFFTQPFLEESIWRLQNIQTQPPEFLQIMGTQQSGRVIWAMRYLLALPAETQWYGEAIAVVSGYFNASLRAAVQFKEEKPDVNMSAMAELERGSLPFLNADPDVKRSPIMSRAAHFAVSLPQVVGHTNQSGHEPRLATEGDHLADQAHPPDGPMLVVDVQASYYYEGSLPRNDEYLRSHPRMVFLMPDGRVMMTQMNDEEVPAFKFHQRLLQNPLYLPPPENPSPEPYEEEKLWDLPSEPKPPQQGAAAGAAFRGQPPRQVDDVDRMVFASSFLTTSRTGVPPILEYLVPPKYHDLPAVGIQNLSSPTGELLPLSGFHLFQKTSGERPIVGRVYRLQGEEGSPRRAIFLTAVSQTLLRLARSGFPIALEMSEEYDIKQWADFMRMNVPPGANCFWVGNVLHIFPRGYMPKT